MSFIHPDCAAVVILKWQRLGLVKKKSIVYSIAVSISVELLLSSK
jgi:hypothetical protein